LSTRRSRYRERRRHIKLTLRRHADFAVSPKRIWLTAILLIGVLGAATFGILGRQGYRGREQLAAQTPQALPVSFVASIDTMKESRDTEFNPLTAAEIAADVDLCASLNTNYITVDTHYDEDAYMAQWVAAIRASGKHVWFRASYKEWGADPPRTLSPSQYLQQLHTFILSHPDLFRAGDIFDPNAEPENGSYWRLTYGPHWSWQPVAPNPATDAVNSFIVALADTAEAAFQQLGLKGAIAIVNSIDPWMAEHPQALYPSTIQRLRNIVTIDAYPDDISTTPSAAASAWAQQLQRIHDARPGARILIGEMGYSNAIPVDDETQHAVLSAELDALSSVPYLVGVNYWVGAGTNSSGGYTHIFAGARGSWFLRPAASALSAFYGVKSRARAHAPVAR
jgi:hypothetical protein